MTSSDEASTRVTLRDVYEVAQETHDAVIVLAGKTETALTQGSDHETRLRRVEKRMYALPSVAGVCAVVSAVGGLFAVLH